MKQAEPGFIVTEEARDMTTFLVRLMGVDRALADDDHTDGDPHEQFLELVEEIREWLHEKGWVEERVE